MHAPKTLSRSVDILIAEDDAVIRTSLRHLLEKQGYSCAEAENGREALDVARARPPKWVLLDLAMPELDGFAVAEQLRSDPRTRAAHIHCLTGRKDQAARRQARQAGCELFLTKPVDVDTLLQLVHQQVHPTAPEWLSGLTKAETENLLDWLETNGCSDVEVDYQPDHGFAVRCPWPSGFTVSKDEGGQVHFTRR